MPSTPYELAYEAVKKRWAEVAPDVDLGLLEKLKISPVKVDFDSVNDFKKCWDMALTVAVEFAEAGDARAAELTARAEKAEAEVQAAQQQIAELHAHTERYGAESQGAEAELTALRQELDEANQEVETLREQVEAAQARGQQSQSSLSMELAKLRVDTKKETADLRTQLAAANAAAQTNQNKLAEKAKADALSIQTLQGQLAAETKRREQLEGDGAKSTTALKAEVERLRRNEKQAEQSATEAAEIAEAEVEKLEADLGELKHKAAAADLLFEASRVANMAAKKRGAVTDEEVRLDDAVSAYRATTAKTK